MSNEILYLNEQAADLSPSTTIALTSQINNLAELSDRQSNLSNQFKLPLSRRNRMILQNADLVQSLTRKPYRKLPARVVKDGIDVITSGYAIIESAENGFLNVTVYSGTANFFDLIDGKYLSDLDLAAYEHIFNLTNVVAARTNITGYKYPIIDYGVLSNANRNVDTRKLRPAFFQHTLIDEIFSQAPFNKSGDIFSDANHKRILIPYSKNDVDFFPSELHTGITTVDASLITIGPPNLYLDVNLPEEWNIEAMITIRVNSIVHGGPGSTDSFAELNFLFGAGTPGVTPANFDYETISIPVGADPIPNGTGAIFIGQALPGVQTVATPGDYVFKITASAVSSISILSLYLMVDAVDGATGASLVDIEIVDSTFYAENVTGTKKFKVNYETYGMNATQGNRLHSYVGGTEPFALFDQLLPELTQKELIQNWANQFGILFKSDPLTGTLICKKFDEIIAAIPLAKDWSDKLYMDTKMWKLEYRSKYGQTNHFKYLEDDVDALKFGDGNFLIDDEVLEKEKDVYTSPFAPTITRKRLLDLDVPIIKKIEAGVFSIDTEPRILIDDTQDIAGSDIHFVDGITSADENTDIPLCYFKIPGKSFNLDWMSLIIYNYHGLVSCLDKHKKVTLPFKFTASDYEQLDHFIPVYLEQAGLYFYINKVINWINGTILTKIELILLQRDYSDAIQFAGFLQRYELEEDGSESLQEDGSVSLLEDN